jgi:hypothetical protein
MAVLTAIEQTRNYRSKVCPPTALMAAHLEFGISYRSSIRIYPRSVAMKRTLPESRQTSQQHCVAANSREQRSKWVTNAIVDPT